MADDKLEIERPISDLLDENWHKVMERLMGESVTTDLKEPATPDLSELDWTWGK